MAAGLTPVRLDAGDILLHKANPDIYQLTFPCVRAVYDMAQEVAAVDARGVIYVGLKYCDQAGYDVPRMQAQLNALQIPLLYIENDYTASGLGQLKVRIEAFAEMLSEEF